MRRGLVSGRCCLYFILCLVLALTPLLAAPPRPASDRASEAEVGGAVRQTEVVTEAARSASTAENRRPASGKVSRPRLRYRDVKFPYPRPAVRGKPRHKRGGGWQVVYQDSGSEAEAAFAAVNRSWGRGLQDDDEALTPSEDVEVPPLVDFTFKGETLMESEEEIVVGKLWVYGRFMTEQIADVTEMLKAAMIKVCGCDPQSDEECEENYARVYFRIMQDIKTFGQNRIGLEIEYFLLTQLKGGATLCADSMAIAGYGNPEPPFDVIPEPVYRLLLTQEMRGNVKTFTLDTADWLVELPLPVCRTTQVVHPDTQPTLPEEDVMDKECASYEEGDGGAGDFLNKGNAQWQTPGELCGFAKTPCMCAALGKCSWSQISTGTYRCIESTLPYVACDMCPYPYQIECQQDPADMCRSKSTPCACVNTMGGCFWSVSSRICLTTSEAEERTPCMACPYQWFCDIPELDKIRPRIGNVLPKDDDYYINVTFDRIMKFQTIGLQQQLNYGAFVFLCRKPPPSEPAFINLGYDRLFWLTFGDDPDDVDWEAKQGDILQIHVNGTPNRAITDCYLLISDDAVEDRQTQVPFLGVPMGDYIFSMADTMGPELMDISPRNGAGGVPLDSSITFIFDEEVYPGVDAVGVLLELGGADEVDENSTINITALSADAIIYNFNLGSEATFELNRIALRMPSGILGYDSAYSIGLAPGSVVDKMENPFGGLVEGLYVFRTGPPTFEEEKRAEEEDTTMISATVILVVLIAVVCWCGCLGMIFLCVKVAMQNARVNNLMQQEPSAADPKKLERGDSWDGSFFQSYKSNPSVTPLDPDTFGDDVVTTVVANIPPSPQQAKSVHSIKTAKSSPTAAAQQGQPLQVPRSPSQNTQAPWRIKDVDSSPMAVQHTRSSPSHGKRPSFHSQAMSTQSSNGSSRWSPKSANQAMMMNTQTSNTSSQRWVQRNGSKGSQAVPMWSPHKSAPKQTGIPLREAALAVAEAAGAVHPTAVLEAARRASPSSSPHASRVKLPSQVDSRSPSPAARPM